MNYFTSFIIGYFLGSLPAAYIFLKLFRGTDITQSGSNNVGALNSFRTSNSVWIGLSVLLVDASKGAAAALLVSFIFEESFLLMMIAVIGAVISHCYNPWLKFKGGKGLATAAGGILVFAPGIVIVWMVLWIIAFIYKRKSHFGNIAATIILLGLAITSPDILGSNILSNPPEPNETIVTLTISILMIIIFSRHFDSFKLMLNIGNNNRSTKDEKF